MRGMAVAIVLLIGTYVAAADTNWIYQHNLTYQDPNDPNQPNPDYLDIQQLYAKVVIYQCEPNEPFEFEAVTLDPNGVYVGPGYINWIHVDPNTVDPNACEVTITVVGHNGHECGAVDVKEINLLSAAESNIGELNISGDLGELGPTLATKAGTLTIGGDVLDNIGQDEVGQRISISGPVTVGTLAATLWCDAARSIHIENESPVGQIWLFAPWGGDPNNPNRPGDPNDTIYVGGSLCEIDAYWDCSGQIIILGDLATLDLESFSGPYHASITSTARVTVMGTLAVWRDVADVAGVVELGSLGTGYIHGDLSGTVHVLGDVTQARVGGQISGDLLIDGSLRGRVLNGATGLRSEPPMSGRIRIGYGDPNAPGDCAGGILIGSRDYYPNFSRDLTGSIEIAGGLYGLIDVVGYLGNPNDPNDTTFKGHIRIDGSFAADPDDPNDPNAPRIRIGQRVVGRTSYVAVDYAGWTDGHDWLSPATVVVEHPDPNDPNAPPVVYSENSPAARIWEITPCKVDMNNDGVVNFGDINPFNLALSSPSNYAIALPGLAGSMVFHADCNCDGTFNFGDINPCIRRLTQGCCDPNCGECPGDGFRGDAGGMNAMDAGFGDDIGGGLSPEQMAAFLAANVDPEFFDSLVTLVGDAAGQQDNEEDAAYWEAVYFALVG